MPKKNRIMLVTCEWKDEFLNVGTIFECKSKKFVLVMGDSTQPFEYNFAYVFDYYKDKYYYSNTVARHGKFIGVTLKVNIQNIKYAVGYYAGTGRFRSCCKEVYDDEVSKNNKNSVDKSNFLNELNFRDYPKKKFLELLYKMRIMDDRRY